ncbi:hypothetical protein D9623_27210 (plasmid) [Azospirillum brasilense]|uniref:Uncharacterized protein n=1 Tax=Azospirillum brasilense TaxID=192 RepID=A0A4D8QTA9_AZOBR|nr:hypothetical protein D3868_27550 [Azospirillum brasilense]QEL93742.1 hypothetical protein D9621_26625 [Azospirillum brasilense]QEM00117.1 hypothetical protein D9623_27210 [Azospirillum brasilense]
MAAGQGNTPHGPEGYPASLTVRRHRPATGAILTRREHCLKGAIRRRTMVSIIFGAAERSRARSFGNPEGHAALLTRSTAAPTMARIASSSVNRFR